MKQEMSIGKFLVSFFSTPYGWLGILVLIGLVAGAIICFSHGNIVLGIVFTVLTIVYIIGLIWFLSWAYVVAYAAGTFLLVIFRGLFGF